jgi:hypothetical protein
VWGAWAGCGAPCLGPHLTQKTGTPWRRAGLASHGAHRSCKNAAELGLLNHVCTWHVDDLTVHKRRGRAVVGCTGRIGEEGGGPVLGSKVGGARATVRPRATWRLPSRATTPGNSASSSARVLWHTWAWSRLSSGLDPLTQCTDTCLPRSAATCSWSRRIPTCSGEGPEARCVYVSAITHPARS